MPVGIIEKTMVVVKPLGGGRAAPAPSPLLRESSTSATIYNSIHFYASVCASDLVLPSRLRKKAASGVTREQIGSSMLYARRRPTTEWNVQLHFGGAASARESSAETAAEDGG